MFFIHAVPPRSNDNSANTEQAYFAKFRISDESFFQTTLCHPAAPSAFPVHNDNLRLVNWPYFDPETEWVLHPDPVQSKHVPKLMNSGALFARKFELGTSDRAWSDIEGLLSEKVGGGGSVSYWMGRGCARIKGPVEVFGLTGEGGE